MDRVTVGCTQLVDLHLESEVHGDPRLIVDNINFAQHVRRADTLLAVRAASGKVMNWRFS
jgi:hypothetical protein